MPYFTYGDVVWGHTYPTHLKRLQSLQKIASKIVLKQNNNYSSIDAIKRLNWIRIENRIKLHTVIYIFKALNGLASTLAQSLFVFSNTRFSSRLSDGRKLKLIKSNNNFYNNSIFYKGITYYNELPLEIRSAERLSTFKRLTLKFFKTNP